MINKRIPYMIVPCDQDQNSLMDLYFEEENKKNHLFFHISREDLEKLFTNDFFEPIALCLDTEMVDEYEEFGTDDMKKIEKILHDYEKIKFKNIICEFYIDRLLLFLNKALELKTGIYFYF